MPRITWATLPEAGSDNGGARATAFGCMAARRGKFIPSRRPRSEQVPRGRWGTCLPEGCKPARPQIPVVSTGPCHLSAWPEDLVGELQQRLCVPIQEEIVPG